MAFDEELAARVRAVLHDEEGLAEKKMFGGLAFLLDGNMACGLLKDDLIVRVGPDRVDALDEPHTRVFDITGRVMRGWVMVAPEGTADPADLRRWVESGRAYARRLPPR